MNGKTNGNDRKTFSVVPKRSGYIHTVVPGREEEGS